MQYKYILYKKALKRVVNQQRFMVNKQRSHAVLQANIYAQNVGERYIKSLLCLDSNAVDVSATNVQARQNTNSDYKGKYR